MDNNPYQSPYSVQPPSPNKLKTFSEQMQKSGSPTSRPPDWFLSGGVKKVTQPQDEGGGGKWVCTMLLQKHVITWNQFYKLALGHAIALIREPNFCYWYLLVMGEVAKRAELEGHKWHYFPAEKMEKTWRFYGFNPAFHMYRGYCLGLWAMYGNDLPHPDSIKLGGLKILFTGWFWKSIPDFVKYQWRLVRA